MSPTSYQTAPPRAINLFDSKESVGGEGFEPSKAEPTDLQSAPFGHSGTHPCMFMQLYLIARNGTNRARTCDPLLVRQVLSQLSYDPKLTIKINDPDRVRTDDLRRDRAAL